MKYSTCMQQCATTGGKHTHTQTHTTGKMHISMYPSKCSMGIEPKVWLILDQTTTSTRDSTQPTKHHSPRAPNFNMMACTHPVRDCDMPSINFSLLTPVYQQLKLRASVQARAKYSIKIMLYMLLYPQTVSKKAFKTSNLSAQFTVFNQNHATRADVPPGGIKKADFPTAFKTSSLSAAQFRVV